MASQTKTSQSPSSIPEQTKIVGYTPTEWVTGLLKYATLIILTISFVLPLYWMVSSALKNDPQTYSIPPVWFPIPFFPENFINAWTSYDFNNYAINSVFRYALPVTIGVTLSSSLVAYGFSRVQWPGRDVLFYICIATMMIPPQVTMVPLFIIFKNLDWINSYKPLVVPAYFGVPYFIFLLRQFFRTIPQELSDAARIDGANELVIYWRIMLPLIRSALVVVALFTFINVWNEYLLPLIYLNREELYPLALGVENMRRSMFQVGGTRLAYPYLMAVSTVIVVPILIIFFFAQRTFIEGISVTGIKG